MRDHGFDSCLAFSDNKNLEIYLYFILFHVYFHHVSHGLSYIFASNFVPRSEASRQALLALATTGCAPFLYREKTYPLLPSSIVVQVRIRS